MRKRIWYAGSAGFVLRQNAAILTSLEVKNTNLAPSKKPTVGFFAGRAANEAARAAEG